MKKKMKVKKVKKVKNMLTVAIVEGEIVEEEAEEAMEVGFKFTWSIHPLTPLHIKMNFSDSILVFPKFLPSFVNETLLGLKPFRFNLKQFNDIVL